MRDEPRARDVVLLHLGADKPQGCIQLVLRVFVGAVVEILQLDAQGETVTVRLALPERHAGMPCNVFVLHKLVDLAELGDVIMARDKMAAVPSREGIEVTLLGACSRMHHEHVDTPSWRPSLKRRWQSRIRDDRIVHKIPTL